MSETMAAIVGVQLTVLGLFLATYFEGLFPYPQIGLLCGLVGTIVVFLEAYGEWGSS